MSLLNEMLNDLNVNKAQGGAAAIAMVSSKPPLFSHLSVWLFIPLSCFAVFAGIVYGIDKVRLSEQLVSVLNEPPAMLEKQYASSLSTIPQKMPVTDAKINKTFNALSVKEWQESALNKAYDLLDQGDEDGAKGILISILKQYPNVMAARDTLATIYLSQEEPQLAEKIIDDGLKMAPKEYSLSVIKARLLLQRESVQDALVILKSFHPRLADDPDFYGLMAAALQRLGRASESASLYKSLLEIEPANAQYWLGYAVSLENANATRQAIAAYERAGQSNEDLAIRTYAEERIQSLQG